MLIGKGDGPTSPNPRGSCTPAAGHQAPRLIMSDFEWTSRTRLPCARQRFSSACLSVPRSHATMRTNLVGTGPFNRSVKRGDAIVWCHPLLEKGLCPYLDRSPQMSDTAPPHACVPRPAIRSQTFPSDVSIPLIRYLGAALRRLICGDDHPEHRSSDGDRETQCANRHSSSDVARSIASRSIPS